MCIAKYQGKTYNAKIGNAGIEIYIRGEENGFQHRQGHPDIISYKIVQENELDEMYTVCYTVTWKKQKFHPIYNEKTRELMLYTTRYDVFTEENNFIEIDRGEQYKIVPMEECEGFTLLKRWYMNGQSTKEQEFELTADGFIASYYENVTRIY